MNDEAISAGPTPVPDTIVRMDAPAPVDTAVAIVGVGCRLPGGADDPVGFWNRLCEGTDAITDIPPDRWNKDLFYDSDPATIGKTYARRGGFLRDVSLFDPAFFGISPREASRIDPQQRLLLMIAWEALEDAGIAVDRRRSQDTGVFVGISSADYAKTQATYAELYEIDAHIGTGVAYSIAANRISHALNLTGPSIAIDTACSSALVAVHLACQSLHRGECAMALAGGVNVILSPETYVTYSRLSMVSPDGRCKAFDARANGFVRGEGAGLVLLKPLSSAVRDGDRIYAVIVASGTNQDGHTPGITVPSGDAQEALLRQVYRESGIDPAQVGYVEAHGTGTPVGDPIEANALGRVLGSGRPVDQPCYVGSVKTNIGHLEAAAGIAGLIKTALIVQHGSIPPNLNFETPNPAIDFDALRIRVPRELTRWPEGKPVVAGVNSFGFGGTNAHVVVSRVQPGRAHEPEQNEAPALFCLSGESENTLRELARACMGDGLRQEWSNVGLTAICRASCADRQRHAHRLALTVDSKEKILENIELYLRGETGSGIAVGRSLPADQLKTVFVFSGQGPQWWAMGRELLEHEPVFKERIIECDRILGKLADWSLLTELMADEQNSRIGMTEIAQPAIFALQVALAATWESWGIRPDAIVGHSVGEVAAAFVAGVLSLEDAVCVIYHRGRCMQSVKRPGGMLAVGLGPDELDSYLRNREGAVVLSAVNSPESVTLSGEPGALGEIEKELKTDGVFCRMLRVNHAFHSNHMDCIRDDLLRSLVGIRTEQPAIPVYSTVTGALAGPDAFGTEYWWQNVRQPVRFATAIGQLAKAGYGVFLEISPHPVLGGPMTESLFAAKSTAKVFHSLKRKRLERTEMLSVLGALHVLGREPDWAGLYPAGRTFVPFPRYAWDLTEYKHQSPASTRFLHGAVDRPLLGLKVDGPDLAWEATINRWIVPYVSDHRLEGQPLLSATAYFELALQAYDETLGGDTPVLEDVHLQRAVFLPDGEDRIVRTAFDPGTGTYSIHSRTARAGAEWQQNAAGRVLAVKPHTHNAVSIDAVLERCPANITGEDYYREMLNAGLDYGPTYRGVSRLVWNKDEVLAEIVAPDAIRSELDKYRFHPALLDACLQPLVRLGSPKKGEVYLPIHVDRIRVFDRPKLRMWSHVWNVRISDGILTAHISVYDEAGRPIAEIHDFMSKSVGDGERNESVRELDDMLYGYRWVPVPLEDTPSGESEFAAIPSLDSIHAVMKRRAADVDFVEEPQELAHLCSDYTINALVELGWTAQKGDRFTSSSLAAELGIADAHRMLFARLLGMLADDDILKREGNGWVVLSDLSAGVPAERWASTLSAYPELLAEMTVTGRFGERMAGLLRGTIDPLELLFPKGDLALAEHLYQDSPSTVGNNLVAQYAVDAMLRDRPRRRKLRILEIGAGTGGTTAHILPVLPQHETEYVFTDISPLFLASAEQRFRSYPFVTFKSLNIEKETAGHGQDMEPFDLVVASQVLHATADLRSTLANVRSYLAPRGVLMAVETVHLARWPDLSFGFFEGWWRFTDHDLRPDYACMPLPAWEKLLAESGFSEINAFVPDKSGEGARAAVIIARAPPISESPSPVQSAGPVGSWLIFADKGGHAARLAGLLEKKGQSCILVSMGESFEYAEEKRYTVRPDSVDDMRHVVDDMFKRGACSGIVHMWTLDFPESDVLQFAGIDGILENGCWNVVLLQQQIAAHERKDLPRLWLVTRGAESPGLQPEHVSVSGSPLWGLGHVIANEYPLVRCTLVDMGLQPDGTESELNMLAGELLADGSEDSIALRNGVRFVQRMVRESLAVSRSMPRGEGGGDELPFRLEIQGPGVIDNLAICSAERRVPSSHEIEIQVQAAGLNFSDILKALNLYPGMPRTGVPLGIECSGVVSRVGSRVKRFSPGDRVAAMTQFGFSSHTTVRDAFVIAIPDGMSFEQGATVPVAFLTAYHSLVQEARLRKGERILIHSASGGVGLAAIQIARRIGAEIYATAGTEDKREFLRRLGVKHVMDSRTLAFADQIMETTGGAGVDVVLNSLAGEAISKGLSILSDRGRFVELGKLDVLSNKRIGLLPFRNNLSFFFVDFDRLVRKKASLIRRMSDAVGAGIADRSYSPLPYRAFRFSMAADAFRHMAHARHTGKVVLSLSDACVKIHPAYPTPVEFRADGSYLITGGLGGFGLLVAEWLVRNGARHIALMSRSGATTDEARAAVKSLKKKRTKVLVIRGDVSSEADVSRAMSEVKTKMPPLRGVVHAAMVLEDHLLSSLTREEMWKVVNPKMKGAWLLHEHTRTLELDFFLLFSSLASVIGMAGQSNYAAGNAFLDSLAWYRRSCSLPATTINWGSLGEVGYLARHTQTADRLRQQGMLSFSPEQALELLARFVTRKPVQRAVLKVDWSQFGSSYQVYSLSSRFRHLSGGRDSTVDGGPDAAATGVGGLRLKLGNVSEAERMSLLEDAVKDQVARILGASAAGLDSDRPLTEMGFDSLMAVELRNWVESNLGVGLRTMEIMRGPTVRQLASGLFSQLADQPASADVAPLKKEASAGSETETAEMTPSEIIESADELSDAQVDALLEKMKGAEDQS